MQFYQTILVVTLLVSAAFGLLLQDEDKALVLRLHNQLRSRIALGQTHLPTAAAMREMIWDDELAEAASAWAGKTNYDYSPIDSRKTSRADSSSENIFFIRSRSPFARPHFRTAILSWYSGIQYCKNDVCALTDQSRSFINMAQDQVYLVGCGYSEFYEKKKDDHAQMLVCQYLPLKSEQTTSFYEKGKTNSKCLETSINYNGLCYRK